MGSRHVIFLLDLKQTWKQWRFMHLARQCILGEWLMWMPDNIRVAVAMKNLTCELLSFSPCLETCVMCGAFNWCLCSKLIFQKTQEISRAPPFPSLSKCFLLSSLREKMPFHHVTAGLLYKGNYLSRSLSDSDSDVLASISVEELHGKASQ